MGLLERALKYRNDFLRSQNIKKGTGLLNKALSFLDSLKIMPSMGSNDLNENDIIESQKKEEVSVNLKGKIIDEIKFEEEKSNYIEQYSKYYKNICTVSNELSKITINEDSLKNFNSIIADNFNFTKNALLIYSPYESKFIYTEGKNIDKTSINNLSFDIEYKNIYKKMISEKSIVLYPEDNDFQEISQMLSVQDRRDCNFLMFIPFIFSGHVIGIFVGLKKDNNEKPDQELVNALCLICKLNGALLYNLFQQKNLTEEKKKIDELDIFNEKSIMQSIEQNDIDISEYFEERLHRLILYSRETIRNNPEINFTVIHYLININTYHDINRLTNDIQFVTMNIIGTNGYIEIFDDLDIYILLPNVDYNTAEITSTRIKKETTKLIENLLETTEISYKEKIVTYPKNAENYMEIFFKIKAL